MNNEYILYCSDDDRYFSPKILDYPFALEEEWKGYTFEKDLTYVYAYPQGRKTSGAAFQSELIISIQNEDLQKAIPDVLEVIRDFGLYFSIPRSLAIALRINSTFVNHSMIHRMINVPICDENNIKNIVAKISKALACYHEGPRLSFGVKMENASIYYEANTDQCSSRRQDFDIEEVSYKKATDLCLPIDDRMPYKNNDLNVVNAEYLNARFSRMRCIGFEGESSIFCAYDKSRKKQVGIFEIPPCRDVKSVLATIHKLEDKLKGNDASLVVYPVIPRVINIFCIAKKLYIETTSIHSATLQQLLANRFPVQEGKSDYEYAQDAVKFLKSLTTYIANLHKCNFSIGGFTPHSLWTNDMRTFSILDLTNSGDNQSAWAITADQIGYLPHRKMTKAQADEESILQIALYLFAPHSTLTELYDTKARRLDEINRRFGRSVSDFIASLPGSRRTWTSSFNFIQQDDNNDLSEKTIIQGLERSVIQHIDICSPYLIRSDPSAWVNDCSSFGLSYGGSGVIAALRDSADVGNIALGWLNHANPYKRDNVNLEGGLFNGFLGIPYALAQIGQYDEAALSMVKILKSVRGKLGTDASLRTGAAGIGITLLDILGHHSDDTMVKALHECIRVCECSIKESSSTRDFFPSAMPTGLLDGLGGVALFLARAGRKLHDKKLFRLAQSGLDREFGRLVKLEDGSLLVKWDNRLMPYLGRGSAGLLFPLLELGKSISIKQYSSTIYGILQACNANTVFVPGLFDGAAGLLAGVGIAKRICSTMLFEPFPIVDRALCNLKKFLLFDQNGISVPGSFCLRLSDDLATGSSGVIYALKVYVSCMNDDFADSKEDKSIAEYSTVKGGECYAYGT